MANKQVENIIDISHHQPPTSINYDTLAKQVSHVVVRTQYGSNTLDRHYKTHHREFQKRGITTSAYAWLRGVSIKDMEKEATDFYNRTKEFNPTVWWLDVEEKSMSDMRGGVTAYINKLRSLGAKKVGVYIAHHLYKSFNLDLSKVDAVWIPHYGANNGKVTSRPSYACDLHQYTDKGRLSGYGGPLDLNRLTGSKGLDFFTGKGASNTPTAKPSTPKPTTSTGSIVDFLNSRGIKSTFEYRWVLALRHGFKGYTGTSVQNTALLDSIRYGRQKQGNTKTVSIVDYLKSLGVSSDFKTRERLAKELGVKQYKGTAQQNKELLDKFKKL